jgi:hypothetical protein
MPSLYANEKEKVCRIVCYGAQRLTVCHKNSCYKVCVLCHVRASVEETFYNYCKIISLRGTDLMPKKSVQHHEYNTVLKNIKIKV